MTDNDKKKQIEEMAKDVTGSIDWCRLEDDFITVDCLRTAEALYEIGYRKQIECEDVSRFRGVFECSECHWTDEDIGTADQIRFCAGCGAKVKGGDK